MEAVRRWVEYARSDRPSRWVHAVLWYGVGGGATTYLGLTAVTATEAGPIAGPVLHTAGFPGLLGLELAFFACFYALWYVLRTPGRVAVPLGIAVTGLLVTSWNALVLVV